MTTKWSVYGLVQINHESKNYSKILINGRTQPVLKIPSKDNNGNVIKKGWKRLTAVYDDDIKEIYLGTLRRTLLFYGAKVWINCPCVFINYSTMEVTLKADLFANNRKVPGGTGYFYIFSERVSTKKIKVVDGHAEETITIDEGIDLDDVITYSFRFSFSEKFLLAPDVGTGRIYVEKLSPHKTRLTVEVTNIVASKGTETKLIARVYHKEHGDVINHPSDIPSGGYIVFYVDGKRVGSANIVNSGYAQINYTVDKNIGIYNITATYVPNTPELQTKYDKTTGCGSLFVGSFANKPNIEVNTALCAPLRSQSKVISFTSDKILNGEIQAYLDQELIHLVGGTAPKWSIKVSNTKTFSIDFDTLGPISTTYYHWAYSGYHNFMIKYSVDDDVYPTESNGKTYPLEYYYYLDYFYIQKPVFIELVGELDTNSQTVPSGVNEGKKVYVGNNIYYIGSDNTYHWVSPSLTSRKKSTTIGHKVKVRIICEENEKELVEGGYVKLTFVTRTENNNMEENINNG